MKSQILNKNRNSYHFIGVGGVSMSGLAKYLLASGKRVSGSDSADSERLEELLSIGANVYVGQDIENVKNADIVVYSSAIKGDNTELAYARNSGKTCVKRSQLLGEIISNYSRSIGVSGSHGKTTTTAMLAHALINCKTSPTVFLGGEDCSFGNFTFGDCDLCLAEVCEYQKNHLDISPKISVLLNIDNDHLDSYSDMNDMIDCFSKYLSNSIAVINADDKYCKEISHSSAVSFGINNLSNYTASGIREKNGQYSFTVKAYGIRLGRVKLKVAGLHNVYNALATIAVCDVMKLPFGQVKSALENFTGVKRRMERIGTVNGLDLICDYAHHPSEITATLNGIKGEERVFTIFQPHTYSRTQRLMADFCDCLINEKNLIIYKTYPAREDFSISGDGKTLYQNLLSKGKTDCYYSDNQQELIELIKKFNSSGKYGLVLGAGDIYDIVKNLTDLSTFK